MSAFYGMIRGNRGPATREGSKASGLRTAAQSYDGSVITLMEYDSDNNLIITLKTNDGSSCYGDTVYKGTFEDFKADMKLLADIKARKIKSLQTKLAML